MKRANTNRSGLQLAAAILLVSALQGCGFTHMKEPQGGAQLSGPGAGGSGLGYSKVRAAVFQPACLDCHGSSGSSSTKFDNYQQTKDMIGAINNAVFVARSMPKTGYSLDDSQRALLRAWIDAGAPEQGASTENQGAGTDHVATQPSNPPASPAPEAGSEAELMLKLAEQKYGKLRPAMLQQKCVACHIHESSGRKPLDSFKEFQARASKVRERIMMDLADPKKMPPEEKPQLSEDELKQFIRILDLIDEANGTPAPDHGNVGGGGTGGGSSGGGGTSGGGSNSGGGGNHGGGNTGGGNTGGGNTGGGNTGGGNTDGNTGAGGALQLARESFKMLRSGVIANKCAKCHVPKPETPEKYKRPMLDTFEQVRDAAIDIRTDIVSGDMPKGDKLSDEEMKDFIRWLDLIDKARQGGGTGGGGNSGNTEPGHSGGNGDGAGKPGSTPAPNPPAPPAPPVSGGGNSSANPSPNSGTNPDSEPLPAKVTWTLVRDQVFAPHCISCHGGEDKYAGLDLTRQEAVKDRSDSILNRAVLLKDMPPDAPLPEKELKLLKKWIDDNQFE